MHEQAQENHTLEEVLTDEAVENAMLVHAAFGGSTNLLIHVPAIAHSGGLRRSTVEDWQQVNRAVPRLVDALPNGRLGLLNREAQTIAGRSWDALLDESGMRPEHASGM